MTEAIPLDAPAQRQAHRVYAALTNHCNRACPWCSTFSSPSGHTWLDRKTLEQALPESNYELQLEGGEPTLHPEFEAIVARARADSRCKRLLICTNGTTLPRDAKRLEQWLQQLGKPLTIKLSINHHLLEHDPGLLDLARHLISFAEANREIILNVRLRRGLANNDAAVRQAVETAALSSHANIFYLQRYGFAENETGWEVPHVVCTNFHMLNPDGQVFAHDLIARSNAMRQLP